MKPVIVWSPGSREEKVLQRPGVGSLMEQIIYIYTWSHTYERGNLFLESPPPVQMRNIEARRGKIYCPMSVVERAEPTSASGPPLAAWFPPPHQPPASKCPQPLPSLSFLLEKRTIRPGMEGSFHLSMSWCGWSSSGWAQSGAWVRSPSFCLRTRKCGRLNSSLDSLLS